jgi:Leucine-rich repeat (LRR) protein
LYSNQLRKIDKLDANLALRELHLQDNEIRRVENVSRLVNLQILSLSGNPLESLDALAEV